MAGNPKHQTHHVAVLAFPFTSHPGSLLDLVLKLAPKAPHVLFSFFTTSEANTSLFSKPSSSFHNVKAHNVADGLPEGFVPPVNPGEAIGLFLKAAPGNFMRALKDGEASTGLKVRCLLTDAFFWFAGDMAEEIKVPWVPVWIGGPHSILVHVETDFIRQRVGTISSTGGGQQALDFLPGLSRYQISDLPEGVVTGDLDSLVATMLHKMGQQLPKAAAVVMNSFDDLAPEINNVLKSRFKRLLNYGPKSLISQSPQLPKDDSGCLEWLDKNKPASVIYIAFGTALTPPPHELEALVQALTETGFPFLWSFRGNIEDFLPKGYNKSSLNGKIVSYAPQIQVLSHASVGVFLTHAGWHSVLESIVAGVPMICRPFFADNMLNMRTVVAVWGIGTKFEGGVITKIGMVKALELVLKHKEGKEMRDKIAALKNLAQQAVESNGSSAHAFNSLVDIVTK